MKTSTAARATSWEVGASAAFETTIDDALIRGFASISGDHNPLHVDDDYAARSGFGGRIAHGMIAGALFSRLVGEHLPGERALYRSQELRFLAPLRPGTPVRVAGEVIEVDPELSLLRLRTTVRSTDDGTIYVEGIAEVVIRDLDPAEAPASERPRAAPGSESLAGRRALIIGGSRGIGATIARELASRGAALAITYRNDAGAAGRVCAAARAAGVPAVPIALELRDPDSVRTAAQAACAALGGVDTLIHAGHGEIEKRSIERSDLAALEDAVRRAAGSLQVAVQALLPSLRERRGSIIALSSSVTLESPPSGWSAYSVAKHALVGLVRSLAVELGVFGVRVNLVSPATTETESTIALPPRVRDALAARAPLGRLARPEDVARAVAFLASDAASFLTGVNLPIAGGSIL